ncbi:AbrB family transcriptional regulator [Cytobacillus sp. Hz8]|uniref:AbrB family transcriptional regulator n=1 Tax=Cytobacillus sp. Hz8 TaxID=3347168 RepID=UPI0035D75137
MDFLLSDYRIYKILLTLATALFGGFLFSVIGIPIPWLLGPMIMVLIGSNVLKHRYLWSGRIRNCGMIIVGYTIGLSMTTAALLSMVHQLPAMIVMTLLLVVMCGGMAYLFSKFSGIDFPTLLMGSIPGGLTQMIILAEETKDTNLTIVTVFQVIRLMMIIITVPFLIFSSFLGQNHDHSLSSQTLNSVAGHSPDLFPNILVFSVVCIVFAFLGNRIHFPTAFLLGPAFGTAIVQIIGLPSPHLPMFVMDAAQLMIGAHVGLMLKLDALHKKAQTIGLALANSVILMLCSFILSMILTKFLSVSMSTALLSLAPGGMDQMSIMASEVDAKISVVASFQLFRTFFIFFAVPSLLKVFISYYKKEPSH